MRLGLEIPPLGTSSVRHGWQTRHQLHGNHRQRHTSEANLTGIKLILELLDEADRLKAALRARR